MGIYFLIAQIYAFLVIKSKFDVSIALVSQQLF